LVAVPREPHPDLGQRRIARVPDTTLRRNRRPRRTQIRPDLVETVNNLLLLHPERLGHFCQAPAVSSRVRVHLSL
jgi:hypothetical protein